MHLIIKFKPEKKILLRENKNLTKLLVILTNFQLFNQKTNFQKYHFEYIKAILSFYFSAFPRNLFFCQRLWKENN
jgi:hypothetical protein